MATPGRLFCLVRARSGLAVAATGWTKAAKAGIPGVDLVVARASWGLCWAYSFLKSVTRSFITLCGDSGASVLRGGRSIWPRSGSNRVDEGGKNRQPRVWPIGGLLFLFFSFFWSNFP